MFRFIKKYWFIFFLFIAIIGFTVNYFLHLFQQARKCNAMLGEADTIYLSGNVTGVYDAYEQYWMSCIANDEIQSFIKYDKTLISNRRDEAGLVVQGLYLCSTQKFDDGIANIKKIYTRFSKSPITDAASKAIETCEKSRTDVIQAKFFENNPGSLSMMQEIYESICSKKPIPSETLSIIQEARLPARYWFTDVSKYNTNLQATFIAEFRAAVCFDPKSESIIETCVYSSSGNSLAGGINSSIVRKNVTYQMTLVDVLTGEVIAESPRPTPSFPPASCPPSITANSLFSSMTGSPDPTDNNITWIEEQIKSLQ